MFKIENINDVNLKHLDNYIWIYTDPISKVQTKIYGCPFMWKKVYHLYGFPNCEIMQLPGELRWLIEQFIKLQPKNILEIGNAYGGTLYYWLKHSLSDAKIVGVDIKHSLLCDYTQWDVDLSKLMLIDGSSVSQSVVEQVKTLMPEVDFLFIDGNHHLPLDDYNNYGPLVKKGIIAFHDINPNRRAPGVNMVWRELKKNNVWEERCDQMPDDNGLGIGIIRRNI